MQDLEPYIKDCELSVNGLNEVYAYVCGLGLAAVKAEPGLLLRILTGLWRGPYSCFRDSAQHLLARAEAMVSTCSLWSGRSSNVGHAQLLDRLIKSDPVFPMSQSIIMYGTSLETAS